MLIDRFQPVGDPVFPRIAISNLLQGSVVIRAGPHDVAAHAEHRDFEQPLLQQVQNVDDAPYATVAVIDRVDALELMMDKRHLDERVHFEQ